MVTLYLHIHTSTAPSSAQPKVQDVAVPAGYKPWVKQRRQRIDSYCKPSS